MYSSSCRFNKTNFSYFALTRTVNINADSINQMVFLSQQIDPEMFSLFHSNLLPKYVYLLSVVFIFQKDITATLLLNAFFSLYQKAVRMAMEHFQIVRYKRKLFILFSFLFFSKRDLGYLLACIISCSERRRCDVFADKI